MSENRIELSGIFSEGYGVIPKRLMRADIDKNIKLILAYMLSYTGGGNECFPAIRTIAQDLKMSTNTIVKYLKQAEENGFITKSQLYPNNPLNHANKYKMIFLDVSQRENLDVATTATPCSNECNFDVATSATPLCHPVQQNNNNINNNNINIKKRLPREKKEMFRENVSLTKKQHDALIETYGTFQTETMIEKLDLYKASKDTKYKSDYHVLIGWVKDWYNDNKVKLEKDKPTESPESFQARMQQHADQLRKEGKL